MADATLRDPNAWAVTHAPASNTAATCTQAAPGKNKRNVCTSITVAVVNQTGATAAFVTVVLRDGATGAGTIIWQTKLGFPAVIGERDKITLSGLNIRGSENTAMCLETTGAPGANNHAVVSMTGTIEV